MHLCVVYENKEHNFKFDQGQSVQDVTAAVAEKLGECVCVGGARKRGKN